MIIHIIDNLTYDTDKPFDEQDEATVAYLNDIIATAEPDRIDLDDHKRETCRYWNVCAEAVLKYIFVYERDESAWNVREMKIEMELRNE